MRPIAVTEIVSFSARDRSPPMISMPYCFAASAYPSSNSSAFSSAHFGSASASNAYAGAAPIAARSERFTARLLRATKRSGVARVKSTSSTSMSVVNTCPSMTAASSPMCGENSSRALATSCASFTETLHRHDRNQRTLEALFRVDDAFEEEPRRRRGGRPRLALRVQSRPDVVGRDVAAPDFDKVGDQLAHHLPEKVRGGDAHENQLAVLHELAALEDDDARVFFLQPLVRER